MPRLSARRLASVFLVVAIASWFLGGVTAEPAFAEKNEKGFTGKKITFNAGNLKIECERVTKSGEDLVLWGDFKIHSNRGFIMRRDPQQHIQILVNPKS